MFRQTINIFKATKLLLILLSFSSLITTSFAFIEGLYCGRENCYDGIYYCIHLNHIKFKSINR